MTRRRWLGLAGSAAVAACVISAGATALAAAPGPHGTAGRHTNYQGPTMAAHPAGIARPAATSRQTNYQGPIRTGTQPAAVHGSNLRATVRQPETQRGTK